MKSRNGKGGHLLLPPGTVACGFGPTLLPLMAALPLLLDQSMLQADHPALLPTPAAPIEGACPSWLTVSLLSRPPRLEMPTSLTSLPLALSPLSHAPHISARSAASPQCSSPLLILPPRREAPSSPVQSRHGRPCFELRLGSSSPTSSSSNSCATAQSHTPLTLSLSLAVPTPESEKERSSSAAGSSPR